MELEISPKLLIPKVPKKELGWRLWEKKTLNIHRGVIEWSVNENIMSIDDFALRIREGVKAEFKPSWFRGFGFGTILSFKNVSDDFVRICDHIDGRNKSQGVWQWAIVRFDDDKVALGIHTWLHGYLRPVFDSLMQQLRDMGYECSSVDAEVDELMATLIKIHRTCSVIQRLVGLLG